MQKIETLSPEQWAEIPKIRQWWLKNASRQIPREDSEKAIELLYGLNGLPKPKIINVSSPLAACILVSMIKKSPNEDSLWANPCF